MNFFLEKFKTITPSSLFQTILLQKEPVSLKEFSLKEFSEAFGMKMKCFYKHPFYNDPKTLVVTVSVSV